APGSAHRGSVRPRYRERPAASNRLSPPTARRSAPSARRIRSRTGGAAAAGRSWLGLQLGLDVLDHLRPEFWRLRPREDMLAGDHEGRHAGDAAFARMGVAGANLL